LTSEPDSHKARSNDNVAENPRLQGFTDFTANGLGRVNLLVGRNNSGKTAFLEAVEFLAGDVDPVSRLSRSPERRGEKAWEESEDRPQAGVAMRYATFSPAQN